MPSIGPEIPPHLLNQQQDVANDSSDEEDAVVGPEIPPEILAARNQASQNSDEDEDDAYGPALPPDFAKSRKPASADADSYGPSLPPGIAESRASEARKPQRRVVGPAFPSAPNNDSDDDIGPMPSYVPSRPAATDGVQQFIELEERRRKQAEEASKPKAMQREEWMLVPPSSSDLLGTLDPKRLVKGRQFSQSTAPKKQVDTSLWTETPAEKQQRLADEISGKKRKAVNAETEVSAEDEWEAKRRKMRDDEIERAVKEHTRHTRGEALVERHGKRVKQDEEDPKDKGIWDHERDMSLGGRLMDDSKRKSIIRDARNLGDRFSSGSSGRFVTGGS